MRNTALAIFLCILATIAHAEPGSAFQAADGIWLHQGKPFYSTTAHAIFHKFRTDRAGAVEDLKALKAAGFTTVEAYWQWGKDLLPDGTFTFDVFDDFVLTCKGTGLGTFCMFQEYVPIWLADREGWGHTDEEGKRDVRVDDFYVCHPTFEREARRYYVALIEHLKARPDVSENVLYWNMGGEYKPFRPHRQARNLDYGYDDHTVAAFRMWLKAKGWSLQIVTKRWGGPTYVSWNEVWPSVNLRDTDYKGRPLSRPNAARWDWYDFRQQVATQHMSNAIRWLREAGDTRPMIHEYNIITPGGVVPFLRWSRVGARDGKDGIHQASGTFDREFDFSSLLDTLAICKGASTAPWQSNEQKGDTPPEWMTRHAWLLVAMGGTGVHFWDWRSEDWGVVDSKGVTSEGYPSAVRLNAQFAYMDSLLAASKPMPNRIGILALSEENLYAPREHDSERSSLLKALLQNGSGCEVAVITDDEILEHRISEYRLIISPGQVHMRRAVREKLADWVKAGGTLWLTPGSASKDEADAVLTPNPGAPLDKVAGVKTTGPRKPVAAKLVFDGPRRKLSPRMDAPARWIAGEPSFALLGVRATATSAEPVAHIGDAPAVWVNRYGKGSCWFQAAYTSPLPGGDTPLSRDRAALASYLKANSGQPPTQLLANALTGTGITPYARVVDARGEPLSTVMVGVRRANPGYLLFFIEGDNRRTDCLVKLNPVRLGLKGPWVAYSPFTQETEIVDGRWSFHTTVKPAECKVLHLTPLDRMPVGPAQRWADIEAKLPPIPEKQLIPPSEIGKIDPGDLANVRPEPHGDKWLLLDLTRHANRSLTDEGKMENAKSFLGSVGVGSNDLTELPVGLQTFVGVPFRVIDAKQNKASCLITKTDGRPWLGPIEFKGIPVRARVSRIHWLYGAGWAPFDLPVGYITYHYSGGTRDQENLVCGRNIMNWWGRAPEHESAQLQLAWSGTTPSATRNYTTVGLYHYAWTNPHPAKAIESIDITSYGGGACIIVVAITGEK